MLKLIQEDIDLGSLGCCMAEIVFYWHEGQKGRVSNDPSLDQEHIEPHSEGIAKVTLCNFPLDRDCDITNWVLSSEYAAKEIEDVIAVFMRDTPEDAEDILPDEEDDYDTSGC